ncbi:MAG: hypothetical protein U5N58_04420 [Actinomycetota bacterium]|nr:hypothetical protein [Actinomycetota bacterium]
MLIIVAIIVIAVVVSSERGKLLRQPLSLSQKSKRKRPSREPVSVLPAEKKQARESEIL